MASRSVASTLTITLILCGILAGQSRPQEQVPTPNTQTDPARQTNGIGIGTAAVDPRTYVIGAEDILFIRVWREADFTAPYIVRPDGKISIPLVGDLQAAGLTPERLADQIEQALAEFINKPDVTVSLQQVNSKKFYITGQVFRPGEFPLIVPTRIFDALSNAGGFRDFANRKKIIIMRGNDRLKFNYNDILKGKNLEQNIFLENGDTIVIP